MLFPTMQLHSSHPRSVDGIPPPAWISPPRRRVGFLVVVVFDKLPPELPWCPWAWSCQRLVWIVEGKPSPSLWGLPRPCGVCHHTVWFAFRRGPWVRGVGVASSFRFVFAVINELVKTNRSELSWLVRDAHCELHLAPVLPASFSHPIPSEHDP